MLFALFAAGGTCLSKMITDIVVREYTKIISEETSSSLSRLSKREMEVLKLIAEGKNTKEIAFMFGVSIKTVEAQRMNTMKKLELYSIAGLTRYALSNGLISMD